jgi:hypothetical protein
MAVMVHTEQLPLLQLQVPWPLLASGATPLRLAVVADVTGTAVSRGISWQQHRGAIVAMQDSPAQLFAVTTRPVAPKAVN